MGAYYRGGGAYYSEFTVLDALDTCMWLLGLIDWLYIGVLLIGYKYIVSTRWGLI